MNTPIRPSLCTVSGLLENLFHYDTEIDNTLLIGEQIAMVNEAGVLYNELRTLVTKDYLTDEEYDWLCSIGNKWNSMVQTYAAELGNNVPSESKDILEELEDQLRDALDDFMGGNNNEDYPFNE
jgi:hypothetical protein